MSTPSNEPRPSRAARSVAFEAILIAGGVVLFLVLLYEMAEPAGPDHFLNPPLIAAAGAILLWPIRAYRSVRALLLSGGFLLTFWLLSRLSGILTPFVLVYLLAYLFDPAVRYVRQRWNVPRWASALAVTALVLGVIVFFVLLIVPSIVEEIETLGLRMIGSLGVLQERLRDSAALDRLEATLGVAKQEVIDQISQAVRDQAALLTGSIPNAARSVVRSLSSLLGVVTILAITPVLLYYTVKDYPFIKRRLIGLFPTFGGRRDYLVKASGVVGNYLRGQFIICAIAAFNVSVALLIFGVPFALLIGLLTGLLNFIPNLGAVITNIIGIALALIFGTPLDALIVFLVLLGQSLIESSLLMPNILSYHVGLHPVLIVFSLFVFGAFLGVFGLLVAVPVTALAMTAYKEYREEMTLELSTYHSATPGHPPPPPSGETAGEGDGQGTAPETLASPTAPNADR